MVMYYGCAEGHGLRCYGVVLRCMVWVVIVVWSSTVCECN